MKVVAFKKAPVFLNILSKFYRNKNTILRILIKDGISKFISIIVYSIFGLIN